MQTLDRVIGVMDPNAFSFRESIESLIDFLSPKIRWNEQLNRISTRRIKCRPYNTLKSTTSCSAIINRGAHWNPHHNSFFQRVSHKTYLLNDMSSFLAINKNTSFGQMYELGLKIPPTYAIPQEDNSEFEFSSKISTDLVFPEYEMFDLEEIGELVGYPAFLKPQDGGGWIGVQKVANYLELQAAYKKSGAKPQNLQKAVEPYKEFIRCVGMGPHVIPMHYNAEAEFSHDRYIRQGEAPIDQNFLTDDINCEVKQICKIINAFYSWDHNSCEVLLSEEGQLHPIDFANAYPDSSLVSLHYYFPELVKNTVSWLFFVVCSDRKKKIFGHDWDEYFSVAHDKNHSTLSYHEKLNSYEEIADQHFSTRDFQAFYEEALGHKFEKSCYEFFASNSFMDILEEEVSRYFKIPEERPAKVQQYKELHQLWLDNQDV